MKYCLHCGKQLPDEANFCAGCGTKVGAESTKSSQRTTTFDGEIHKCPHCGEVLKSFASVCPACGYELRGVEGSKAAMKFSETIRTVSNTSERNELLKTYVIPNTKEDIVELFNIACNSLQSISLQEDRESFLAWAVFIDRCYEKASMSFSNQPEYEYIVNKYQQVIGFIKQARRRGKLPRIISIISTVVFIAVVGIILLAIFAPIKIDFTEEMLIGESYQYVTEYLKEKGFRNIIFEEKYVYDSHAESGVVFDVKIDGKDTYKEGDKIDKGTAVLIQYYTKTKIEIGKKAGDLKGKNYLEVETYLRSLGFTNIRFEEKEGTWAEDILYQNNDVFDISINATSNFKSTTMFYFDDLIIITVYKT